jgi:hypothetical protein
MSESNEHQNGLGFDLPTRLAAYDAINNQAEREAEKARKLLPYNRNNWLRYYELRAQCEELMLLVYTSEIADDPQSWVDNRKAADMAQRKTVLHARPGAWATDANGKRIARCVKIGLRYRWRKTDLDAYVASGGRVFKTKTEHRRVSVCVACGSLWPCPPSDMKVSDDR